MVIVLLLAVAVGALAQATTGIGFTLVVVPACALLLEPGDVLGTVARLGLLVDLVVLYQGRRSFDPKLVAAYAWPAALAVPVALVASAVVPERGLVGVAAVVTMAGGILLLRRPVIGAGMPTAAGFASGFLGVTVGMPGPPVAVDSARRGLSPEATRASLAAFFAVLDLGAALAHPSAVDGGRTALLVAAAVFGLVAGHHVARRADAADLRRALAVVVVAAGTAALARLVL